MFDELKEEMYFKEIHLFYINNQKFKQSPRKSLIC